MISDLFFVISALLLE